MKKFIVSIWILLVVCGLFIIRYSNLQLVQARKEYGITQANPLINAPPLVVFTTVALGGFRGIIADMLWMRSSRLQYEGKFFELVQLADWITKLEPRFTEVWAYHAWNLSYNISVLFPNHADRWRWVRHGFSMIRDEGLLYNPGEPRLLYELGWIFQHKIAGSTDDAHLFYKQSWANEMQAIFENGRPAYDRLLNAAKNKEELMAKSGLPPFIAELQNNGLDPFNSKSLQIPENHAAWTVIHRYTEPADAWFSFLLRQKLVNDYKLYPSVMKNIEITSGPLDWRLPQAHAIYWATLSMRYGEEVDAIFANRMIYQSMADAFRRGQIFTGKEGNLFIPSPYPDLLPFVIQAYEQAIAQPGERGIAIDAYQNFLTEAAILMFLYDRTSEAELALRKLTEISPESPKNLVLSDFVLSAFTGRFSHMKEQAPVASIDEALYQGAFWNMNGHPELASGYEKLAGLLYTYYQANEKSREYLPPLDVIRKQAESRARQTLPRPE